jgi:hypothetical protein
MHRDRPLYKPAKGRVAVIVEMHEGTGRLGEILVKHNRLASRRLRVAGPLANALRLFSRKLADVVLRCALRILAGAVAVDGLPLEHKFSRSTAVRHL